MEASPAAPEKSLGAALRPRGLELALVGGAILLTYGPALFNEFAITDDWSHLADRKGDYVGGPLIAGRPIYALALRLGFGAANTVASLACLRLVAVAGLVTFAWLLHRHLVRHGWTAIESAAVALASVALPGPMLFANWATCFPFPWAMALGGLAFVAAERGGRGTLREGLSPLALATASLTLGFLIYQPAAPTFWAFFAVAYFSPSSRARIPLTVRSAVVFGISAGLGLVAVSVGKSLYPAANLERTRLMVDLPGKVAWFVQYPLVEAWSFVLVHRSVALAIAAGIVAALGIAVASTQAGIQPAAGLVTGAALLAAAYAPNLAVAENFASFRSEASLVVTALVLLAIGLRTLASRLPGPLAGAPVLATLAAASLLAATATSSRYLAAPHGAEIQWVRASLSAPATRVLVVPRPGATTAPDTIHDELGFSSTYTDWSARAMVTVVMRERGYADPTVVYPNGTNAAEFVVTPGTAVLDAEWLVRLRPAPRP